MTAWNNAVYPCVYREHLNNATLTVTNDGLSLCIQGTHHTLIFLKSIGRFIPVYTGNTTYLNLAPGCAAVYPCVYREHPNYNILFYN